MNLKNMLAESPSRVFAVLAAILFFATPGHADPAITDHYFMARDEICLHYLEAGAGDRILIFIPGWMMPASVFREQLRQLSTKYRVIAFDPRSQGRSQVSHNSHRPELRKNDLEDLIKEIRAESYVLAGWSLGVLEILDYTRHKPIDGLRGVVLIDNSIGEGQPPPATKPGKVSNRIASILTPSRREAYLRSFVESIFKPGTDLEITTLALQSALQVPPLVAVELIQKPYPREYWSEAVYELKLPILYLVRPWLKQQALALRKNRPLSSQVEIFPEASHALFVDESEHFNALVSDFAERAFLRGNDL